MSPTPTLKRQQLLELYKQYKDASPWPEWEEEYLETVQKFQNLSPTQLREVDNQEALWKTKAVSSIGPGEGVDVSGAYQDAEIVDLIVSLQNKEWEKDKQSRAKELQRLYNTIIEKVHPKYARVRPQAKLGRLFASLVPQHTFTGLNWQSQQNVSHLVLGKRKVDPYEGAVLVRERLREVLGAEESLAEHIKRSTFCWWLHSHYDEIIAGDPIIVHEDTVPNPTAVEEGRKLVLWPFIKQGKGITAVSGYIDAYRSVISAAENGATPEDIVDTMISDLGFTQSPSSCRSIFNSVRRIGLLEHRGGAWYPSEAGIRLTEEDPPDVLVEKFLVETFGMAHLLRILQENSNITRKEIYKRLREIYPRWTTDMAPSALIAWAGSLGLIDVPPGGTPVLSEYGSIWCDRLPDELEFPDVAVMVLDSPGDVKGAETEIHVTSWPRLSTILSTIADDTELGRFVFDDSQIESLHIAWHCNPIKRFVLLSGLSGTGKTAILFHYARIYCELLGLDVHRQRAIISVSPDWRDPCGLLGYFNALHADPTFQLEPALRLVLDAVKNPSLPYFLILDEMNLARVERYFAPFLSAMETGEQLHLHAHSDEVNGVPPAVRWPKNLFIGGTVNMDETTYPFSDKVLDRAFTFEFWDVDLKQYLERRAAQQQGKRHGDVEELLLKIHSHLQHIRRQFAYRTTAEILDFFDKAEDEGRLNSETVWKIADQVIFAKVLPRIRGEESEKLKQVLKQVTDLCEEKKLVKCTHKLESMQDQLNSVGVTRFWA
jgi:hypothetical protein